jgi:serine protease AprX
MQRIVKILCPKPERGKLDARLRLIAEYDAFVVVETDPATLGRIARKYPVEDLTDLYRIRVGDEEIDTSRSRREARGKARPGDRVASSLTRGPHHYLVQFVGPIKAGWLAGVKRAGGEPRNPYADFTYVVRADEGAIQKIAGLAFVRWVGHLPHAARVAAEVWQSVRTRGKAEPARLPRTRVMPGVYTVEFFGAAELKAAIPLIKKLGLRIAAREPQAHLLIVQVPESVQLNRAQVLSWAAVHGVKFIRERVVKRSSNNVATGIMNSGASTAATGLGLDGTGEIVGICDTGLDTGNPATIHADFRGRIASIRSYPITQDFSSRILNPGGDDGPADRDSGHGTHVAGSVLGDGAASSGLPGISAPIRGLAHGARLVFQAVEQEMKWKPNAPAELRRDRYLLSGIPTDLARLFADAYQQGARVHSDSWGGGAPGEYDVQCEQLDRFVWGHKDFCVVVAAGNDGTDHDGDGKINLMSVTSPGTAKNCITVGACENLRPEFNSDVYGEWWPQDFPVAPFARDPMANKPGQIVPFSSRGPTHDGRYKPDVVAPGTFILSTRSTQIAPNNMAWAAFPPSRLYFHMGGTSMATPLTAGAVALIRQYYRQVRHVANPSAALLKATLIAGCTRLSGSTPKGVLVDNHQGFGRVNLDAAIAPAAPARLQFQEVTPGLRTGEAFRLAINVTSGKSPLRVVLAYTDYPGARLVNNLNLVVTSPTGRRYVGNQSNANALTLDAANNAEAVRIPVPATGAWSVEVLASNVPHGPQDFALVSTGRIRT